MYNYIYSTILIFVNTSTLDIIYDVFERIRSNVSEFRGTYGSVHFMYLILLILTVYIAVMIS